MSRDISLRDRAGNVRATTLVDDDVFETVGHRGWYMSSEGYARCGEGRTGKVYLHRMILGLKRGDARFADHINRNRLDNRRANLRIVTRAEQQQNVSTQRGTSRFRGVYFRRDTQKWVAKVKLNYKDHYLGCFDTEEEAAEVAAAWRRDHMPFSTA